MHTALSLFLFFHYFLCQCGDNDEIRDMRRNKFYYLEFDGFICKVW